MRLGVEDGQGFDFITLGFQIVLEVLRHGFRVLVRVALPLGTEYGVQAVMVDGLFLVAANRVDQLDQLAIEHAGSVTDQLLLSLFACGRRRLGAVGHGLDFTRLGS